MLMFMNLKDCLFGLSSAAGVGGYHDAADTAMGMLSESCDNVSQDALGNVIGWRRSGTENAPVMMLEAHIDEVGFVVTGVTDDGFVRVSSCGRADPRALPAAEVMVYGDVPCYGVFVCTPPHLAGDSKGKVVEIGDIFIDVGMSAEEARGCIHTGNRVGFCANAVTVGEARISGKSMDDRAGVASILRCLEILKDCTLSCDIAAVFAVQEELGCRGSATAAFSVKPDMAIAVDVSYAVTPDADAHKCGVLGGGPMVGYSPVLDNEMTARFAQLALREAIPFQHEVMGGDTGTDADAISGVRAGVPSALLSIPLRYMHTPVELVDTDDIENTAQLMAAYVKDKYARSPVPSRKSYIRFETAESSVFPRQSTVSLQEDSIFREMSELCALDGVSGAEDAVRGYILQTLGGSPANPKVTVDAMGNVIADITGKNRAARKLLFAAHMDEVGLIITGVTDGGYLRFAPVGGIDPAVLYGKRVRIGKITGVIGGKAIHQCSAEERAAVVPMDKLLIDIGVDTAAAACAMVAPGERAVFDGDAVGFGGGRIKARALDDRAGCALLLKLAEIVPEYDITLAFTVQEEVGLRGAKAVGFAVAPDVAVVVDSTTAADIAGVAAERRVCALGGGPVVSFMDGRTLYDFPLYNRVMETAKRIGVRAQVKSMVAGGNDAGSLQTAGDGARVAAVSLPCRYLHSPSSVVFERDVSDTLTLLRELARELAGEFV